MKPGMPLRMQSRVCTLSALLAIAAPCSALALPSPQAAGGTSLRAVAHQAAPADAQVAIILQRKPANRKPPPPKRGH